MHFTFKLRDQLEGNCPSTYNKGGGSSTTTTSSSIDPEFKPYLKEVLADVTGQYQTEKGAYGDLSDAYGRMGAAGERLGAEAAAERAALDQFKTEGAGSTAARQEATRQLGQDWSQMITDDLTKTAASGAMGMSQAGALGSARAQMAQQGALADRAMQLRQTENQAKGQAGQALSGLDAEAQKRYLGAVDMGTTLGEAEYKGAQAGVAGEQGQLEAPHEAAKRYFGYLGSGAVPTVQTSTTSGGGGK